MSCGFVVASSSSHEAALISLKLCVIKLMSSSCSFPMQEAPFSVNRVAQVGQLILINDYPTIALHDLPILLPNFCLSVRAFQLPFSLLFSIDSQNFWPNLLRFIEHTHTHTHWPIVKFVVISPVVSFWLSFSFESTFVSDLFELALLNY